MLQNRKGMKNNGTKNLPFLQKHCGSVFQDTFSSLQNSSVNRNRELRKMIQYFRLISLSLKWIYSNTAATRNPEPTLSKTRQEMQGLFFP